MSKSTSLNIFVFGSNPIGINGNPKKGTGGSALIAHLEFGVELRECMDNCLSKNNKADGINLDKLFFIAYDGENPNAISLNGKTRKTLARLFKEAGKIPNNVIFEKKFCNLILNL